MKLIVLIPTKNEEWILDYTLSTLHPFVDHIIIADQKSTDSTRDICKRYSKVTLIENEEVGHSNRVRWLLLDEARKIEGQNLIFCIDADEIIHPKKIEVIKREAIKYGPGTVFSLPWIQLWGDSKHHRIDGVWKENYKSAIFYDDRDMSYQKDTVINDHTSRVPTLHTAPHYNYANTMKPLRDIPLFHFQFLAKERVQIKQAWYRCSELIASPHNGKRINYKYSDTKNASEVETEPVPADWLLEEYTPKSQIFESSDTLRMQEILNWFDTYGIIFFESIDIWSVPELRESFIRQKHREPRVLHYPKILISLNTIRRRLKNVVRSSNFLHNKNRTHALFITRGSVKKILYILPHQIRVIVLLLRELWWRIIMNIWEKMHYPNLPKDKYRITKESANKKVLVKNILVYHISGLSHGGTEKNLQLIASGLSEKYNVFFMYGNKIIDESRKNIIDQRVKLVPFSYSLNEVDVPHKLHNMKPHMKEVLEEKKIDLIITASPGYAHYPWNIIEKTPIILNNVFGAPSLQKNIVGHVFVSETVLKHAEVWTGKRTHHYVKFAPIGKMPPSEVRDLGSKLRSKIGIPESDFVFGRIGRDSDTIFDPIGIYAWQSIAEKYPETHFLIMSPPDILKNIVANEKIPRVHFIPPSGDEKDIWSFHGALDAMAHFRKDGETSGVAIAESLTIGNPIITHRSTIWNAHLDYLTQDCARVANIDSIEEYAAYMEEFISLRNSDKDAWKNLQKNAAEIGYRNFSPDTYVKKIHDIIENI